MNRYIVVNGRYEEAAYYVITAADMSDACENLAQHFDSLPVDDRPSVIDIYAIGVFDESAIVVRIS